MSFAFGGEPVSAFVCTIGVDNFDSFVENITAVGGSVLWTKCRFRAWVGLFF